MTEVWSQTQKSKAMNPEWSQELQRQGCQDSSQVKAPDIKLVNLSLISRTHMIDGENSHKLPSDFHEHAMAHGRGYAHMQAHILSK